MQHCSLCLLPTKACRCRTVHKPDPDAVMWPILDGSLATRCKLKILQIIAYDEALILQLPADLQTKINLCSMLKRLQPVLTHDLLPNLFPVLQHQEHLSKLKPYLHVQPDGRPDLGKSFHQLVLAGLEDVALQPDAVLSLACEFYAWDIIDHYWMMLSIQDRHAVIVKDPFVHCTVHDLGLLQSTLQENEAVDLLEKTLVLAFREPSCSSRGCELFFKRVQRKRGDWFAKVLFGSPMCYMDTVVMQSAVYLPLSRALIMCFPVETFTGWGQRTWCSLSQHLALWLELWPLLEPSQKVAQLLKWLSADYHEELIPSELLALTVREKKHMIFVTDCLNTIPREHQSDQAMSILSFALHHANFPILSEFFMWAPNEGLEDLWEELLVDYIHWSNSTEFSALCTLLSNAKGSFAISLARQIIAHANNLGNRMVEPSSEELKLLFSFCVTEESLNEFVTVCTECCFSNLWSWELFGALLAYMDNDTRSMLHATAFKCSSRQSSLRKNKWWLADWTDVILHESQEHLNDQAILNPTKFLWQLLLKGQQPVLFNLLWENLLAVHEREKMRDQFTQLDRSQWLQFIGIDSAKPECLQIVLERLLIGKQEVEDAFWDELFEHDYISDYATQSGAIPVEEMSQALPSGPKESFIYDCFGRYCGMYQIYANNPATYHRYKRATLASCILETEVTLSKLPQSAPTPTTQALIQALLCSEQACLEEISLKGNLKGFLEEHGGEILMTSVLHLKTQHLLNNVDSHFERKLVTAHDWWNSLIRINMPSKICVHGLNAFTPLSDNGRRTDPSWLKNLFKTFCSDTSRLAILPVAAPGLLEFGNLDARLDVLSEDFGTLLDLMIPVGDTGMMGTAYQKANKQSGKKKDTYVERIAVEEVNNNENETDARKSQFKSVTIEKQIERNGNLVEEWNPNRTLII